jgi:hypothetical protein
MWSWEFLNDYLPRGIRVMDIDGMLEINKHFLFLEGKQMGAPVPKGQNMALSRLAKQPRTTVVILEGHPPMDITKWYVIHNNAQKSYTGNTELFIEFIRRWVDYAEGREKYTKDEPNTANQPD